MSDLSEADRFLLEQIRSGNADGWAQLVSRYQGRLVSFARTKLRQSADAEDLVQDTFLAFLKGLQGFRGEASIETYLFTILRRKIINWGRGKKAGLCLLQDVMYGGKGGDTVEQAADAPEQLAADEPTASWYARRDEAQDLQRSALTSALRGLIERFKSSGNFRDLQVVELLFYSQLRNKDAAEILSLDEKHVGLIKHRCLKEIRERIGQAHPLHASALSEDFEPYDALITEIWQTQRLSCLKRSTIGAHLLGSLDDPWQEYVTFHLERLGCTFCQANLEDLRRQTADDTSRTLRDRIMESTVGFLSRP
ncbi:MAG: RNA polymerase sigma factor [Phycisphaerae bacterium]|nr:RNA polymerase sigma factor [Phycisphaerae bacterium]